MKTKGTRRDFLGLMGLGVALALPRELRAAATKSAAQPNVLIVLVDDAGYGDYSCHGNPVVKTPNVDKLHDEAIRLADFHVAPMCTPTRSQLTTGVDCLRNGACIVTSSRMLLRPDLPTSADIFAANGYRTGQFGKWHMGDNYPFRPQDRGFQDVLYFHLASIGQSDDYWCNDYFDPWFHRADGQPRQFKGYCNDILFTEAMNWMRERADQRERFFCYLPLNLVHGPLLVPQKYRDLYKDQKPNLASGFGMLANIDENMGRLDAMLHASGLRDNTIVIFLNDNGGTFGVPVWNAGMRGHKTEYYEGGHRTAFFLRWPAGQLRPAGEVPGLTEVQDLLPTLVDLCGLKDTQGAKFDGISLAPVLRSATEEVPDRTLVVQYGVPKKGNAAVMWRRWRLVKNKELYDLTTDLAQQKNVIADHPDIVAKLRADYEQWWQAVEPWTEHRNAIFVGDDHENPTTLMPSSLYDVGHSSPDVVRQGTSQNDGWLIEVAQDGKYEFGLRRWPEEAHAAICGSVPAWRTKDRGSTWSHAAGKALPIVKAQLSIGDFSADTPVAEADRAAIFTVPLKRGQTRLKGSFLGKNDRELCGSFYVTVRRI